ncbi:unnamed protein product [Calicophoron daubneyi]|uniref:C2H2-type domain-containing protein n=1 Tax=Calicophoron daubneyi TaxID=300641 RepID=A0AAV2T2H6_CALDB
MKMRIRNISATIQTKRLRLWKRIQRAHTLAGDILVSKIVTGRMGRKPAHTKSWLRQIEQDMRDLGIRDIGTWNSRKPSHDPDYRPRLLGERDRNLECPNEHCKRKFATIKEMNRHVREDHTMSQVGVNKPRDRRDSQMELTEKFRCPIRDCYKSYKTRGWLERHIRECHPTYEGMKAGEDKVGNRQKEGDATPTNAQGEEKATTQACPYPNCNKILPTWKGIVNHCYRVHRWSAITKQAVRPRTTHAIS